MDVISVIKGSIARRGIDKTKYTWDSKLKYVCEI